MCQQKGQLRVHNWIWQNVNWPKFTMDSERLLPHISSAVRAVSPLVMLSHELTPDKLVEFESKILLEETISTSLIEKIALDRDSVRSSIARHLGLPSAKQGDKRYEYFTTAYFESIRTAKEILTETQLKNWHAMLFIEKPVLRRVRIGDYREDKMNIVSGHFGRNEIVHFEAPCDTYACVQKEMQCFIEWLNNDHSDSSYIRAAIAKFWFVTIHPFDDGNGRLSRIIAERCLAEADNSSVRLYSISAEIEKNKGAYYDLLERCQKGSGDITDWIIWFLKRIEDAAKTSMARLNKVRFSTVFWDKYRHYAFNARQRKLLVQLLDTQDFEDGIARRKYKNLVATSDATAARDLQDLVAAGVLNLEGQGRSVKYFLNLQLAENSSN